MDPVQVPPGFRFDPKDEQLINYYLKPKVDGNGFPCNIIIEKDIYDLDCNPWDVFDFSADCDNIVYVFTRLTRKASCSTEGKKEQYVRKAGCGTWHGETTLRPITDKDNVVGFKRLLVFQINDDRGIDFDKVGYYRMHEYVLPGHQDYALCRITLDTSKKPRVVKLCPKPSVSTTDESKVTKKTTSKAVTKSVSTSKPSPAAKVDRSGQVALTECRRQESLVLSSCSVFSHGSDQGIVKNGMPQHGGCQGFALGDDDQGLTYEEVARLLLDNSEDFENPGSIEEKDCRGFTIGDDDQQLTYEEVARMSNTKNFDNPETDVLLNFSSGCKNFNTSDLLEAKSWSEKDIEKILEEVPCSNNVQPRESMSCNQALDRSKSYESEECCSDLSTLNFKDSSDDVNIWTEEDMVKFLNEVLNDSNVPQHQPPMQNMSCSQVLGKRKPLEAQIYCSGQSKKSCI